MVLRDRRKIAELDHPNITVDEIMELIARGGADREERAAS